jgi:hypothetical protein
MIAGESAALASKLAETRGRQKTMLTETPKAVVEFGSQKTELRVRTVISPIFRAR